MTDFDWLMTQVELLSGMKQEIEDLYSKTHNTRAYEKGNWAFKKLLILAFYIDIFTNVAKKHRENIVYADLLAGPGFNYLKDIDLVVAGSPLLAKIVPRVLKTGKDKSFNKMILIDNDPSNCDSLKQIINGDIYCEDCNSFSITQIINDAMKPIEDSLLLTFIDPEGLQVHWSTMLRLFDFPGDFVINYPYSGVGRACGSYHSLQGSTKKALGRTLDSFFGAPTWRLLSLDHPIALQAYYLYLSRLRQFRSEIIEFPIMMYGGAQYRILVAAKKTSGGSPWLKPVVALRDRIESITDNQLDLLVEIYKGKQKQLTEFF